jgi:hypothetical protein
MLSKELGASHLTLRIDAVTAALVTVFSAALGRTPRFAKPQLITIKFKSNLRSQLKQPERSNCFS